MTPELFMEWKKKKIAERDEGLAAQRAERAKNDRMSGRELFLSDASLFVDDAEAYEKYQREEESDAPENKVLFCLAFFICSLKPRKQLLGWMALSFLDARLEFRWQNISPGNPYGEELIHPFSGRIGRNFVSISNLARQMHEKGIPFHAWSCDTFTNIASKWGKIIAIDEKSQYPSSFDRVKIQIFSSIISRIDEVVRLKVEDQSFDVLVREIDPSFKPIPWVLEE
ncbi:hypothetical protein F3Y22_tig00110450pilonHSYRG00818 [Hibiscus syriacus]|uniref:ZC3H15/TMA46 family C-terminal domain-containing protein n=1 Tax=Hibiscus syriacus TaxID=106335 RepID=A0A6A3AJ20_HIBSY|nr:hypothetical protein F3Y22_tig00110450pilonHSYRG00818 [Hibiscus syriacus]